MTILPANDTTMPPEQRLNIIGAQLSRLVQEAIFTMRVINPAAGPLGIAAEVHRMVGDAMNELVPEQMRRLALLAAYEATHDKPMNFVQVEQTKQVLTNIAQTRAKVEKHARAQAAGLVLPQ